MDGNVIYDELDAVYGRSRMKNTLILWRLELKRTIKLMPAMLLEAALLLIILLAIAYGAGKLLYKDSSIIQINVAIIEEEENPLTDFAVNYIQGMEGISEFCRFISVTKEEGFSMLRKGEAAAVLYIPEGMIEGIMNGNNVPAQLFFPKDVGIESALLKELADIGVQMLKAAQAQIYGIYDTAKAYGALDGLTVLQADIDMYNLAFAMDRLALYKQRQPSEWKGLNTLQYGIASAAVFFIFLIGMACYPMMQPYPDALRRQLVRNETDIGLQCIGKWLCGLCSMFISVIFFLFIIKAIFGLSGHSELLPKMGLRQAGTFVVIIICIATFVFMIFQMTGSGSHAILLLFFGSILMMYLSGGILPYEFLPDTVRNIGEVLPTAYLIEAAGSLYLKSVSLKTMGILLLYTAVFGALSYIMRRRGRR